MVLRKGRRHSIPVWQRGLALVKLDVVQTSLAPFRTVS
jgi:hypothetical protein